MYGIFTALEREPHRLFYTNVVLILRCREHFTLKYILQARVSLEMVVNIVTLGTRVCVSLSAIGRCALGTFCYLENCLINRVVKWKSRARHIRRDEMQARIHISVLSPSSRWAPLPKLSNKTAHSVSKLFILFLFNLKMSTVWLTLDKKEHCQDSRRLAFPGWSTSHSGKSARRTWSK